MNQDKIELMIKFSKSSSQNYTKVINYCKKFDTYAYNEETKTNTLKFSERELLTSYSIFEKIYTLIQSWKGTEIQLNKTVATSEQIKTLKTTLTCASNMNFLGDKYCYQDGDIKEGWHCKHLQTISRYFSDVNSWDYMYRFSKPWYNFGNFKDDIWIIDKNRIKEILFQEAESKFLNLCPYFKSENIESILSVLPESIDPKNDEIFEYKTQEINSGFSIEEKRTGIKPKKSDQSDQKSPFSFGMRISLNEEKREEKNRYIPDVSFNDIGGLEDIIGIIREVIELPIKQPGLFEFMKIIPHKGILLYGPPGCGKTMIAKAIANEIDAHFIGIKGPELLNKYQGQSEENLRNIFEEAKELEPSIIFFDEIDSIAQQRSGEENLRFESRFVNQLLTLLDGIEDYGNIRVLASTNRPELLDDALLRPGRFDYHLEVKKPTEKGCFDIFNKCVDGMPISNRIEIKELSKKFLGLTGADISFISREGAYNCLRRNINFDDALNQVEEIDTSLLVITEEDFLKAFEKMKKK